MSSAFGRKSTFKAAMSGASATSSHAKLSSSLATKIAKFTQAEQLPAGEAVQAVQLYSQFLQEAPNDDGKQHVLIVKRAFLIYAFLAEVTKYKELAILKAAQLIKSANDSSALAAFVRSLSPVWVAFARAKTAKLSKVLNDWLLFIYF